MRLNQAATEQAMLGEIGRRIERVRLAQNLTQKDLAAAAAVSRGTVQRLEAGQGLEVAKLLRILRALGLLGALDAALPEDIPSPIDLLRLRGRQRQRASRTRRTQDAARPQPNGPEITTRSP